MKVVILAGGFGTRLNSSLENYPKPMAMVGNKPILHHLMNIFSKFSQNEFLLALGYKKEMIIDYFINYKNLNSDINIDMSTGLINHLNHQEKKWNISLIDTGLNSMTGGRLLRLKKYLDDTFILTYGDGLSNINIDELIRFHKSHKKMVTVTAVRPIARFGELDIEGDSVKTFSEKPQINSGWINGGFFVMEPEFLELIDDDQTVLEKGPLEKAASLHELMAYKFDGFWQCLDTKRDLDYLNHLNDSDHAPWI
tara:strand:- start:504 stop:1262 length:759 start_codon:yes stop_codon:yes gene_type:complete